MSKYDVLNTFQWGPMHYETEATRPAFDRLAETGPVGARA